MAVPKFFEFFEAFLQVLQDGELHTAKEVKNSIAEQMNISGTDLAEMLPSGRQTTFGNRVMWARTYLNKAGLIETPSRGRYRITKAGSEALASGEKLDLKYLERFDSFMEFHRSSLSGLSENTASETEEDNESPMEVLDSAYKQVTTALASELMDEVMKLKPAEFENW